MARLRIDSPSVASTASRRESHLHSSRRTTQFSRDPSDPGLDQENRVSSGSKHTPAATSSTLNGASPRSAKRRKLAERGLSVRRRDELEEEEEEEVEGEADHHERQQAPSHAAGSSTDDGDVYDPHQSLDERQRLRKSMRELHAEATDNQKAWLAPSNDGLFHALQRSDNIYKNVKQTSDAVLDSRFLVTAGDIAYKRTSNLISGDNSQGIDLDEFVGRCKTLMAQAQGSPPLRNEDDDDEDDEQEDPCNWAALGRDAAFIHNSRPPLPGFLLGPLSVQKRIRQPTQRRARQARDDVEERRPEEMDNAALGKRDDNNLTAMCTHMHSKIKDILNESREAIDRWESEGVDVAEIDRLLEGECIADNQELWLFHFVINPYSFGQTIENLFYLSFLIRDGLVGIDFDSAGMPTISNQEEEDDAGRENRRGRATRYQGILSLDFETWEDLIETFNLRDQEELLIPDRSEEEARQRQALHSGWYR